VSSGALRCGNWIEPRRRCGGCLVGVSSRTGRESGVTPGSRSVVCQYRQGKGDGDAVDGGWFDPEALESERKEADFEQAALEASGRWHATRLRAARSALRRGDKERAAKLCPHGWRQELKGSGGRDDARHGQEGFRCLDCGSYLVAVLDPEQPDRPTWAAREFRVVVACEAPAIGLIRGEA